MWYEQLSAMNRIDPSDALDLHEQELHRAEVARIQDGINTGKVWANAMDGTLAAAMIASGECRERRA